MPAEVAVSGALLFVQTLNGLQFGILLYLMAAGLTLVLGVMNFINLAHGSLYMMGAYFAASLFNWSGSFVFAGVGGVCGTFVLGLLVERITLVQLYERHHLDQVLATFGLILFFNELARIIWGPTPYYMGTPKMLTGTIEIFGIRYPAYRFVITIVGLVVAAALWALIHRTRFGMLIRAGATNRAMVGALGINIKVLTTLLFGIGAALAGLAGFLVGPILSVQAGMGDPVLVLTLVVIVIGGIGSMRGAFLAALIVGLVDIFGQVYLPLALRKFLPFSFAQAASPALSSMTIYLLMAVILAFKPLGLFPVKSR
jgi:branched-chain amino acid transport system permease protein